MSINSDFSNDGIESLKINPFSKIKHKQVKELVPDRDSKSLQLKFRTLCGDTTTINIK